MHEVERQFHSPVAGSHRWPSAKWNDGWLDVLCLIMSLTSGCVIPQKFWTSFALRRKEMEPIYDRLVPTKETKERPPYDKMERYLPQDDRRKLSQRSKKSHMERHAHQSSHLTFPNPL
ncbi:hypothetical protein PENTCL1PPCAC_2138 [Pristionchus entomophagus]|uniref:Uncharacterized protein n=1 Tax=Pristionchus entomophagus TaxID=358040 RepID=A0AAV5SH02_9BILA|nr:hypothetical protein PENTCL1PPCAC_2138 [Pristionchus entomophagus]